MCVFFFWSCAKLYSNRVDNLKLHYGLSVRRSGTIICIFAYIQALGTGFSPFAEPVFQRCISIIQSQQVAKVGQSMGEILLNSMSL